MLRRAVTSLGAAAHSALKQTQLHEVRFTRSTPTGIHHSNTLQRFDCCTTSSQAPACFLCLSAHCLPALIRERTRQHRVDTSDRFSALYGVLDLVSAL